MSNICFDMSHVFNPRASDVENAYALKGLLDCMVYTNLGYLKFHKTPRLRNSGVRYSRTQVWYPIPKLYQRGAGDCKSLATALVAEYRLQGINCWPVFRFKRSGDNIMFHIVVCIPGRNGLRQTLHEDPSRELGMNRNELSYF